jgi:hypothetical protein
MKRVTLYDNWKDIVRRAWSIRFIVLAGLLSGCEVILPLFYDAFPRHVFAILSFFAVTAAFVSRIVAQKDLE